MRVRAVEAGHVYLPHQYRLVEFAAGAEFVGEDARYLAAVGAPVEVIEADEPAPAPAPEPVAPKPAPVKPDDAGSDDSADDTRTEGLAFDPATHTAAEVLAYATAHLGEVAALVDAEKAGKGRSVLLRDLAKLAKLED